MSRTRLQAALDRMERSRRYTKQFLSDLQPQEWFWQPSELPTHIAWQVAHVAVAQYMLCLFRARGKKDSDNALVPEGFLDHFKRGSVPAPGPENNPSLDVIQRVFDAVHRQALAELAERTDEELDAPLAEPHPAFKTKLEAVEFASTHELVHAGQIGLLRRLMGKPPVR
jgi:DinB superfamily